MAQSVPTYGGIGLLGDAALLESGAAFELAREPRETAGPWARRRRAERRPDDPRQGRLRALLGRGPCRSQLRTRASENRRAPMATTVPTMIRAGKCLGASAMRSKERVLNIAVDTGVVVIAVAVAVVLVVLVVAASMRGRQRRRGQR